MAKVFLAPHNDDETLFGAFTIQREQAFVCVCLQAGRGTPAKIREEETADAMRWLRANWEQWPIDNSQPDVVLWPMLYERMTEIAKWATHVYAPWPNEPSHPQHRLVGEVACQVFRPENLTHYLTYYNSPPYQRSTGIAVPVLDPVWAWRKATALTCYQSQWNADGINHFLNDQREYYAS